MTTTQEELLKMFTRLIESLPEDIQIVRDEQFESGSHDVRIIDLKSPSQEKFNASFDFSVRRPERTNRYISEA